MIRELIDMELEAVAGGAGNGGPVPAQPVPAQPVPALPTLPSISLSQTNDFSPTATASGFGSFFGF